MASICVWGVGVGLGFRAGIPVMYPFGLGFVWLPDVR